MKKMKDVVNMVIIQPDVKKRIVGNLAMINASSNIMMTALKKKIMQQKSAPAHHQLLAHQMIMEINYVVIAEIT